MNSNHGNTGAAFAAALQHQFDEIDAAYARGDFGSTRRDAHISDAFFKTLNEHYAPSEPVKREPINTIRRPRSRRILHHRVTLITGADSMMLKRGRREFEIGLCSVRVPVHLQDQIASALCELLQFERVRIRICCRDAAGLLRGVVEKVDEVPTLAGRTVNATLIAAGLGHAEARCRRCETGRPVSEAIARDRLERLLAVVNEQAEQRFSYLLQ